MSECRKPCGECTELRWILNEEGDRIRKYCTVLRNAERENEKWEYRKLSNEEAFQLAEDISKGLVFTSEHIREAHNIISIFMPLIFANEEQRQKLINNPPGMIYEYLSKAGPRSINGYPIFLSVELISREDANKVDEYYRKIMVIEKEKEVLIEKEKKLIQESKNG